MDREGLVRVLGLLIALSIVGGALKVYGSVVGRSKSVFVDAMTSIANTLAIILMLKFFREGMEPPDKDHHYGHYRLAIGGSISMLMLYSFVAGFLVLDLVNSFGKSYEVGYESPIYAAVAMVPYGIAILIARRSGSLISSYGGFTAIEIIESTVSIASSLGGVLVSYVIDFVGAITLTGYLFHELVENFWNVMLVVSDAASKEVMDRIYKTVEGYGVNLERVRVRRVVENVYHGDIVVKVNPSISIEEAHTIADRIEKDLRKQGIEVVVHVEPSK